MAKKEIEEIPLEDACFFNIYLRCHPKTTGLFNSETGSKTIKTETLQNKLSFIEKVCVNCPTHIFIKDKGIPRGDFS